LDNAEKIIVSSDKDFFQLLNKRTIQYRPIQKEILNEVKITDKFNIHPNNFSIARAMEGDKSDNIDGIEGLGLKTIAKRFPFLKDQETVTLSKLLDFCKDQAAETNVKAYTKILENEDVLRRNYQMMQLYTPTLSIDAKKTIRQTLKHADLSFNKTELIKMMLKDGFGEINFSELFQHFNRISVDNL